ncbi:MAG: VPLPA-CTERM sorting domain-containing protein [Pseudomonadota bacterium]
MFAAGHSALCLMFGAAHDAHAATTTIEVDLLVTSVDWTSGTPDAGLTPGATGSIRVSYENVSGTTSFCTSTYAGIRSMALSFDGIGGLTIDPAPAFSSAILVGNDVADISSSVDFIDVTTREFVPSGQFGFNFRLFDTSATACSDTNLSNVAQVAASGDANSFGFRTGQLNLLPATEDILLDFGTCAAGVFFDRCIVRYNITTIRLVPQTTPVPLPSSSLLLVAGLGGLVALRRRRA